MSEGPGGEGAPPLYAAVLATQDCLLRDPAGTTFEEIGTVAWRSLTKAEQRGALPRVLGAYVHLVHDEERARRLDREARDTTHTYLGEFDAGCLWDAATLSPDTAGEVPADRQALLNVLCELELLQHRLAILA